ncbi:MAG: hypothetical protein GYA14_10630 [Ignavibacteria bacterium]|nr:hypothetical protein [Ignavibacteria bacterium]
MKYIYRFALLLLGFVILYCSQKTEPTSPGHQGLILSRNFDSVTVHLNYGEEILINDYAELRFYGVASDSRCPIDAICVWAGNGEVKMTLNAQRQKNNFTLNTLLEPRKFTFDDFTVELKALNPLPRTNRQIKPDEYSVDLIIKPASSVGSTTSPIKLINGNNTDIVKRDMLSVNAASINKDEIKFNVSYSGGCKEHSIELYAFKEIQKTNPAQVTLLLSHNANNDMCEAYLTKTVSFNLSNLKSHLKSTYNISDQVLLIIHDPSGRPLNNPVIVYNF